MTLAQRLEAAGIVKGGTYRVTAYDWPSDNAGARHHVYTVRTDGLMAVDGVRSKTSALDLMALLGAAEDGRAIRVANPSAGRA